MRASGGAVGYAGLASCGSVWACPVCNARVQAVRRMEVGAALAVTLGTGGGAAFGAYTVRHHAGSNLDELWRGMSEAWKVVTRDGSVKRQRERMGYLGMIRAVEVTHGDHGWHPHTHPLMLFSRPVTDAEVADLHAMQTRAWRRGAVRLGLDAPSDRAQHLHAVSGERADEALGDYFTKASYPAAEAVAWEATSTQTKSGVRAKGSRTPWQVLKAFYTTGDVDELELWREWERSSKGKRALTWSRGLRSRLGLDAEATDEEIAEEEIGTRDDTGFFITDWSPVRAAPRLGAELLSVIGSGADWAAGRAFCAENGIPTREGVRG